ncbi:MAG: HAD family hydrolase [Lachnospiraceae bacterium]|nr:HAD family hydrolase [Lachnospiraceae bacterium]
MKDYKYIFFDLDGTITDPGIGITNGVMYSLTYYGIPLPPREELYKFIGPPLMESYQNYYGFSKEKSVEALAVYREYYSEKGVHENELYPGIEELLIELKKAGKRIVLATSKPEYYAKIILEHFQLSQYFTFIGGSDMAETVRPGKADVIMYDLESCGITDLSEVVMIGDREHDVLGAKKAGIDSIGVLYGYGDRNELETAGADYIVEGIDDLKKILI